MMKILNLYCYLISIFTNDGDIIGSSKSSNENLIFSSIIINSWFDYLSACESIYENLKSMKFKLKDAENVYCISLNEENFYLGIITKEDIYSEIPINTAIKIAQYLKLDLSKQFKELLDIHMNINN